MSRDRSSQIGIIKEKCDASEVGKYEGIETEERFRYVSDMGNGSYGCCHGIRQ